MSRRPFWLPLAGGLLVMVLTVQLGNWQLRRAAEKDALGARIERAAQAAPAAVGAKLAPHEWQTVGLRGTWVEAATIYLDNRTHQGRAGYHVLTPLQLDDGGGWVLVNRGWIAAEGDRSRLPMVPTSPAHQQVTGMVRRTDAEAFTLAGEAGSGQLWQFVDLERYRAWSGLAVAAWMVQQTSAAEDGLVRDWPRPDAGADRHRGYAVQWYGMAALAFGLSAWYLRTLMRSRRRDERSSR